MHAAKIFTATALSLVALSGCAATAVDAEPVDDVDGVDDREAEAKKRTCLFGTTYGDLSSPAAPARTTSTRTLTAADLGTLSVLQKQQIVLALQQSSNTDVKTAEQAFARADGGEINVRELYDEKGARTFTAYEYGAGDNSYGAIFAGRTTTLASKIQDGDLVSCTAFRDTCLFGSTFSALRTSKRFTLTRSRVITSATGLSTTLRAQIVRAVRESWDVTSVTAALKVVDGGQINVYEYSERSGAKRAFVAVEFGAGDNSYGAVFPAANSTPAAVVNDGDLYACNVFR
jgi:hypothetical protein